ncbi:MAG: hypothetical protein Q8K75_08745 [Chlamydiales bacterium]|nr:hypothetical protein [Chlamydiales bacterium]
MITKSLSYSKNIIRAIPSAIDNLQVGSTIVLGAACSLNAIINNILPALNFTYLDCCITLGSLMAFETLCPGNKVKNDPIIMPNIAEEPVSIDYSRRNIGHVEPLITKGHLIRNRLEINPYLEDRYRILNIGSQNTVDEVCRQVALLERCDPTEVRLLVDDSINYGLDLSLGDHAQKTLEEAFAEEYKKTNRVDDIGPIDWIRISISIKSNKSDPFQSKGSGHLISGRDRHIGHLNTLNEICESVALERNCNPEEVYLEMSLENREQKWIYFGLKEDKEKCDKPFGELTMEKHGIDLDQDEKSFFFEVRIMHPTSMKSARSNAPCKAD